MIQDLYRQSPPEGMEELMGDKLLHLFSDIKIEEDFAISVFVLKSISVNKGMPYGSSNDKKNCAC